MHRRRFLYVSALFSLFGGKAMTTLARAAEVKPGKSLENLVAAHSDETGDVAWSTACAQAADKEGYAKAAQLFRASAASAKVHGDRLSEVITKLGGKPGEPAALAKVGTTKENLEAARLRESGERKQRYAGFTDTARKEANKEALRAFNYASATGDVRAKYYKAALDNLDSYREAGKGWWVCTVCGYTVTKIDFARCLVCFNPKEKYTQVA
jgi:rubrerythrin